MARAENIGDNFYDLWLAERSKEHPSLWIALHHCFGRRFYLCGLWRLVSDIIVLSFPFLIWALVSFIEDQTQPIWKGLLLAFAVVALPTVGSLCNKQYQYWIFVIGAMVRAGLIAAVYKKGLRLSNFSKQQKSTGEIMNIITADVQRTVEQLIWLHIFWSAPMQIIVATIICYKFVGVSIFAGLGVIVALAPVTGILANLSGKVAEAMLAKKDARIKIITEVLLGIRVIKMFAYETPFLERIAGTRKEEIVYIRKGMIIEALESFIWRCSPFFVTLATFCTYALLGNALTVENIFPALGALNNLRMPISDLPWMFNAIVTSRVSLGRIQEFLCLPELDDRPPPDASGDVVSFRDASYAWDPAQTKAPILDGINFRAKKGSFTSIVGPVASGKSSLLSAALGEMTNIRGQSQIQGSVAYCAQTPWILNATLRDNVLFGSPYDKERYEQTLSACALQADLEVLPGGDNCEIGEKGINLSGGQKHRVALARAVYRNADVYLLDDPLSAVDVHVAKHIFERCIQGVLKGKTIVLVTHQLFVLPYADLVVVLKDGKVDASGTLSELKDKGINFATVLEGFEFHPTAPLVEKKLHKSQEKVENGSLSKENSAAKLIKAEERAVGSVKFEVYKSYILAAGLLRVIIIFFSSVCLGSGRLISDWFLSYWASHDGTTPLPSNSSLPLNGTVDYPATHSTKFFLSMYFFIVVTVAIFTLIKTLMVAFSGIRFFHGITELIFDSAASNFQLQTLLTVIRAPLLKFEATPIGRILSRFSKDQETLDKELPFTLMDFTDNTIYLATVVGVIMLGSPMFIIAFIPVVYLYYKIQNFFRATSRELKRLESIARSPVYSHFAETLNGLMTIRAYGVQRWFLEVNSQYQNRQLSPYVMSQTANRWLAVNMDLCANLIVGAAALFGVVTRTWTSPALIGLALSHANSMTQSMNVTVRLSTDVETKMNAVERMLEYMRWPQEAPAIIENRIPPPGWPHKGEILMKGLQMKYREDLPPVLNNITLSIRPREKLGICGRTGAGKSSLMLALLRLVEPSAGTIVIDDLNALEMGLESLRSKIAIIPQDPLLFSGNIRSNLDPFGYYTEEEALEKVQLKASFKELPNQLDYTVAENGDNFSVGQRQLICLARALLRKSSILIMDEATAAVDVETDGLIQKTIRQTCSDVTVLTIAHRLDTILDYDRIVVLQAGQILEVDSPKRLLENPQSHFALMLAASRQMQKEKVKSEL